MLTRRRALSAVPALCLTPSVLAAPEVAKNEHYQGDVVPLARALAKHGAKLDADAAPHWLALSDKEGALYPLIKDDGSRMFFKDERLLNRPMRLTGRLAPKSRLLQVVNVHSYVKGELHEVYYWCDICSIRRSERKLCDCCGGLMELKETPVPK